MTLETLQGRLNAKKEETISQLKERGKFLEFCEEKGFIYLLEMKLPFAKEVTQLMVGMKNGWISVLDM